MPTSPATTVSPKPCRTENALGPDPAGALERWPAGDPVCAFLTSWNGRGAPPAWEGFSILARTPNVKIGCDAGPAGTGALHPVRAAIESPGGLGVGVAASYELGRAIEPHAGLGSADPRRPRVDRPTPTLAVAPATGVMAFDHRTGSWTVSGDVPEPSAGAARAAFRVGRFSSCSGRDAFQRSVARAIEYIHSGDCLQVNLSHRVTARFEGSARALSAHLHRSIQPALGAHLEIPGPTGAPGTVVVSVSPELFLRYDAATRRVTTRPIKGTRSARDHESGLATSAKDGAELAMIVDLMRNDLGRVCEPGSIAVADARAIERFGADPATGVRHGVATVTGVVRADRSVVDLIEGAFPPGSVTGAPKIRAMQIIEELEPVARGPYCGTIGWFHPSGDATLSVPIRTAVITLDPGSTATEGSGVIDLHVGAGIVADSDPESEWRETLHKAATILAPLGHDAMEIDR